MIYLVIVRFNLCLQDAVVELSEHGIVLIVEESRCLQAKVYLQREVRFSARFDVFAVKLNVCLSRKRFE